MTWLTKTLTDLRNRIACIHCHKAMYTGLSLVHAATCAKLLPELAVYGAIAAFYAVLAWRG